MQLLGNEESFGVPVTLTEVSNFASTYSRPLSTVFIYCYTESLAHATTTHLGHLFDNKLAWIEFRYYYIFRTNDRSVGMLDVDQGDVEKLVATYKHDLQSIGNMIGFRVLPHHISPALKKDELFAQVADAALDRIDMLFTLKLCRESERVVSIVLYDQDNHTMKSQQVEVTW